MSFHAAQTDNPYDPAAMLIHADWLEEHGYLAAAEEVEIVQSGILVIG